MVPIAPRILVCGAGSAGQRHVKNLIALGADVSLWRQRSEMLHETARLLNVAPRENLQSGIADADAVVIASETTEHIRHAQIAAELNKDVFIEKPLSASLKGASTLKETIEKNDLVCEIGCQLRASTSLRTLANHLTNNAEGKLLAFRGVVGHRLDQWRPTVDYRASYSAHAERGGGALLDLIHEIDLAIWLGGRVESVFADMRQISDHEMTAEDLVNLFLSLKAGGAGQLQLDMLSPAYRRNFEVVTEKANFEWDYLTGKIFRSDNQGKELFAAENEKFERNNLFLSQMSHFLKRLEDHSILPMCSLDDAVHALEVVVAAKESSKSAEKIQLPNCDISSSQSNSVSPEEP